MKISPYAFKIRLPKKVNLAEGNEVRFISSETDATLVANYIGRSIIDRKSMFKTQILENGAVHLSDVFDGATTMVFKKKKDKEVLIKKYPSLISTLEDQVEDFTGTN